MEKEEKRITKRDNYEALKKIVEKSNVENAEMLVEFINKQIEMIDNKSAKAKEKAAEKRAEGDELRAVIKSVLTNEYQTVDAITAQIEGEDITKAKVVARLTQLVNNGEAVKEQGKSEDNKKVMMYKLAD